MFKKTLLAATLAALSTSAMAIDVATNTTTQTYSYEGIASGQTLNDGSVLTLGVDGNATVVSLALGAGYTQGDTITITLNGAKFDTDETFTLEQTTAGTTNEILVGFLNATDTTLTFRVTGTKGNTNGLVLLLDDGTFVQGGATAVANAIILDSAAIGATASITAAALTGTGLSIDVQGSAKDTFIVSTVVQQHKFTVATADVMAAKVDVALARKEFSGTVGEEADFIVTYGATAALQGGFTVPGTGVKYTINGSMKGFEATVAATDNDGTIVATTAGALTVAADLLSASVTGAGAADDTFTFAVDTTPADRAILNVGSYTVDVEIDNGAGDKVSYTGLEAGSFSLNGSSATYAYAPVNYSGAITTQFEIGNSGAVDGEITVTGFDTAGTAYSAVLPFLAEAGKLTRVSDSDIATALALTTGTKLQLSFTVNAPDADITYGGYSNRGTTGRMSLTPEL